MASFTLSSKPSMQSLGRPDKIVQSLASSELKTPPSTAEQQAEEDEFTPQYYTSLPFIGTCLALSISSCSPYIGWVMTTNILTLINDDIGTPDSLYLWISLSWILAASITFTLVGRLSDMFGRRWFFIGGNMLGLVGTVLGATARTIHVLIGANSLVGLGAAVQLSFPIIIGEMVPNRMRGWANGLLCIPSTPFAVFGPILARILASRTSAGWRWVFYINIITTAIGIILFVLFYHPTKVDSPHSFWTKFRKLDFGGLALFTGGITAFLVGISEGGQTYPWKSVPVITSMTVGIIVMILFCLYETYANLSDPLVPLQIFLNRGFLTITLTAAVSSMIYYSINVLWPIQIQVLYSANDIKIGWLSCIVGGAALLGQLFGGALCAMLGNHKWQMIISTIGMTSFIGALAVVTASNFGLAVIFVFLGSFFDGYIELVTLTTAPLTLDSKDIGLANGALGTFRYALATVATSMYSSILNNKLTSNVPRYISPVTAAHEVPESSLQALLDALRTGSLRELLPDNPDLAGDLIRAFQTAYSESFKVVYLVTLAFGLIAIIAAILSPNLEHKFTNKMAKRLPAVSRV